jgi:hypothetical protein
MVAGRIIIHSYEKERTNQSRGRHMKSIIFVLLAVLMMALISSPVAASLSSAMMESIVDTSGGFQSGPGSSDTANLIHSAHANYQANPESAVNIYLIPDMGDTGLTANAPTPYPAFNERHQVPDVFAAFNQPFPSTMIFQGSSNDLYPVLIPIH